MDFDLSLNKTIWLGLEELGTVCSPPPFFFVLQLQTQHQKQTTVHKFSKTDKAKLMERVEEYRRNAPKKTTVQKFSKADKAKMMERVEEYRRRNAGEVKKIEEMRHE